MGFLSEIKSFQEGNIIFSSEASSVNGIIGELVERLKSLYGLDFDSWEVIEEFIERERKGSTGVMEGVALPHIRTDLVEEVFIAVGLHRGGIDFKSANGKQTHVVILSIFPVEKNELCLKFLSSLSRFLLEEQSRSQLLMAKNRGEVLSFLREGI